MNIYEARWRNALKIARRVNELLAKGYTVRDEYDHVVTPFTIEENTIYRVVEDTPTRKAIYQFFDNDRDLDHGLHTTITEFNARFDKWTIYHPSAAQSLIRRRKK